VAIIRHRRLCRLVVVAVLTTGAAGFSVIRVVTLLPIKGPLYYEWSGLRVYYHSSLWRITYGHSDAMTSTACARGNLMMLFSRPELIPTTGWEPLRIGAFGYGIGHVPVYFGQDVAHDRWWVVRVPITQAAITLGVYPLFVACRTIIRKRRSLATNGCTACGYDLTGNASGMCPECGLEIPPYATGERRDNAIV